MLRRFLSISILSTVSLGFVVNKTTPPLCNFAYPEKVYIGTTIPICIFMMSAPTNDPTSPSYQPPQIKSIAFGVKVDTYSMLTLSGSYSSFNHPQQDQDNLYAWATGGPTETGWARECALEDGIPLTFPNINATTAYSCPQLVMTVNHVVPVASLVAIVDNGTLINLIWDNQCQTCPVSSDLCVAGNLALTLQNSSATQQFLTGNEYSKITDNRICSVTHEECVSSTNPGGVNCDFQILLTWQGTDLKGKRLTSSSLRMTQFSGQSVGSMWDSVANSFDPNSGETSTNTVNVR